MIPSTDREAISLIIDGLTANGVRLEGVYDEEEFYPATDKETAMGHIFDVDNATLHVILPKGERGWLYFVLGNEPIEVLCNCTVSMEPYVDPITDPWWN